MNIRKKLFTGFSVTTGIALILGVLGLIATTTFNSEMGAVKNIQADNTDATNTLNEHFEWRQEITDAIILGTEFTGVLDPDSCAFGRLKNSETVKHMSSEQTAIMNRIEGYHSAAHNAAIRLFAAIDEGNTGVVQPILEEELIPNLNEAVALMIELEATYIATVAEEIVKVEELSSMLSVLIIVFIAVALTACIITALYIAGNITAPMVALTRFLKRAGDTGDVRLREEDKIAIGKYIQRKDEIGQCISSAASFIENVVTVSHELEQVAGGDLSIDVQMVSDEDLIGKSLRKMLDNLNDMFGEINASTAQVSTGAKQIADGSQSLAQGATEQAASVEQLSSSIAEVAAKTKENAEMAARTASLAGSIMGNAEKGSRQMDEMMTAVEDINNASHSISKVIKTIDDIAFQTNILALNAAVEAARAGQHGKGFAVVAEEVRSLAAKSADAARETGEMIQNSMEKAELGNRIAGETATSLGEIVQGINESSQLISQIAQSSDEQSAGIEQINRGIDQVAQVVQQTSATAQESAAASEEMSGQSDMLQSLVEQFKLRDGNTVKRTFAATEAASVQRQLAIPQEMKYSADVDYGKY